MADLPAMDPCPCDKHGRHELSAVLPEDRDGDMTLFCDRCGALRRVPVSGPVMASRLDDLPSDAIATLARRADR